MDDEKEENDAPAQHGDARGKFRVLVQPVDRILVRPRPLIVDPDDEAAEGVPDEGREQHDFDGSDDRIRDKQLRVLFVEMSAVAGKKEEVADQMLHKEQTEKKPCEAHDHFFADGGPVENDETIHNGM